MAPCKVDLDIKGSTKRRRQDVKGFLYSPFCPCVQAVFARYALFWNKGLFPRIEAPNATRPGRKRQCTLAETRLLAVLISQHGRNSEVRPSLQSMYGVHAHHRAMPKNSWAPGCYTTLNWAIRAAQSLIAKPRSHKLCVLHCR
jgi:hypothetical protein